MGSNKANELKNLQTSRTETHSGQLWNDNPTFTAPITKWYGTVIGDTSDAAVFTSSGQANYEIIGESYEQQVILNSETTADSDYIITSVNFSAIINGTVNANVDTPGDTIARTGWSINQFEKYDFAQFYVEISTIDIGNIPREIAELNTFRIAFNQTRLLGNDEGPTLYSIEGLIGEYGDQAIIDALTNVLANDPGHNEFCVVLGIYIYCEDNQSNLDRDDWTDLRFKNLNLTFNYVKKINQGTEVSWKQDLNAVNGSNVQILDANLKFDYGIDKNWTKASENSRIIIFINDRECEPPIYLKNYIYDPQLIEARSGGFDLTSEILPYENFTLEIQVYLAEDFGLEQNYTISIDNVYLRIT
ncbi:MAG: hypothetical protein P8Y23_05210, partial [Candidatus Lokiarchaeota archaeon]